MGTDQNDRTLQGFGVRPWTWVKEIVTDLTCAWADTRGFHVGTCPTDPPPYTHLWAWDSGASRLVRVRLDVGNAIVGVLSTQGQEVLGQLPAISERVKVRVAQAHTFRSEDTRIGAQAAGTLPGRVSTFTVVGPMPITFVGPASGPRDA